MPIRVDQPILLLQDLAIALAEQVPWACRFSKSVSSTRIKPTSELPARMLKSMLGSGSRWSTFCAEATRARNRRSLAISVASSMMSTPNRLSVMIRFLMK